MKHLEEQSATWWKKRFQAVVSLWVCSDTKKQVLYKQAGSYIE